MVIFYSFLLVYQRVFCLDVGKSELLIYAPRLIQATDETNILRCQMEPHMVIGMVAIGKSWLYHGCMWMVIPSNMVLK